MTSLSVAASTGFFTSIALILAIGAQNAFVLKQGIIRSHIFWVCLICAVSDALLISAGVFGFGVIVEQYPSLPRYMTLGGAAFLVFYGLTRFLAAYAGSKQTVTSSKSTAFLPTIVVCLALTWLNPHVYLDTLGLIGAVSTQYLEAGQKIAFGIGAVFASFVFFFSLGYGARFLAPIMQTENTWRILDVLVGLLMWFLAYGLLTN